MILTAKAAQLGSASRVLIYRLGSIGDTVVSLPCFHHIEKLAPNAERLVLTNHPLNAGAPTVASVLEGSGLVHGFVHYPVGTRSFSELSALRSQLLTLRADVFIYLTQGRSFVSTARDALFFGTCGFGAMIGVPLSNALRVNRSVGPNGEVERECARLARCLGVLGPIDVNNRSSWDLRLTPDEWSAGRKATQALPARGFLAINMGGKAAENDWGLANWRDLVSSLRKRFPEHGLLIVGGAPDRPRAEEIAQLWGPDVSIACGTLSPRECAAALAGAAAFVGHDSGPMHMANAMGVPCIGLFGEKNPPGMWHPLGQQNRSIHKMTGVKSISVAEVFSATQEVVTGPGLVT